MTQPVRFPAAEAPPRSKPKTYPEPFAHVMQARIKRPLDDLFGLKTFGVKLTRARAGGRNGSHTARLKSRGRKAL